METPHDTEDDALLREAAQLVSTAPSAQSAFDSLARTVQSRVPFERASLSAVEATSLDVVASFGVGSEGLPGHVVLPRADPQVASVLESNAVMIPDLTGIQVENTARERGVRSAIAVPLVVRGEVRALVSFVSRQPYAFTEDHLRLCEAVVRDCAGPLNILLLLDRERAVSNQLRQLDALKTTFVGIVAHDLRSPMQVIAGFAETMRRHWSTLPEDDKLEYLGIISRNIANLAQLVDDVLQVARIEAGELEYRTEPFDLRQLVLRTVVDLGAESAQRCVVDVPDDLPMAMGDERRQWQVLSNLVGNALKFSDESTSVEVRAALRVDADDAVLEVAVRDHGIGIRADDIPRVFDKFSRLSSPDSDAAPKGSGLGLFICKTMVEAQGGTIDVESEPGRGSTFRYTIPTA